MGITVEVGVGPAGGDEPNPLLLPVATTSQVPLTTAYDALDVPSLAAGEFYYDPTTNVKIWKLTSATWPTTSANWGHDYSDGGNEISLPYNGTIRAILIRQNGGNYWLIDFTPGVGVSNARQLTGVFAPDFDLAWTFSNKSSTPQYAYVGNASTAVRRVNVLTMAEASGDGWPVTGESDTIVWLHQAKDDSLFTWMRGGNGTTVVGYEPSTTTLKTHTDANTNEPRIDREGRYIGICMNSPPSLNVWDWLNNTIVWTGLGYPYGVPFAHVGSLRRRWYGSNWDLADPCQFTKIIPDVIDSGENLTGPSTSNILHGGANWVQPAAAYDDQWAMFLHYGSLRPSPQDAGWIAPGGMVLITANGQRRVLAHSYNVTSDYTFQSYAKFSPDGRYVLFTSDMNSSGRSDVFLAEMPVG